MALTVAQKGVPAPPGDRNYYAKTLTLDNSYPNPAGYVVTPATLGLNSIRKIVNIEPTSLAAAGKWGNWLVPTYNQDGSIASFALHLAVLSTGVEVANATDVSTASYVIVVEGN